MFFLSLFHYVKYIFPPLSLFAYGILVVVDCVCATICDAIYLFERVHIYIPYTIHAVDRSSIWVGGGRVEMDRVVDGRDDGRNIYRGILDTRFIVVRRANNDLPGFIPSML
jgi:hypothetical protein